MKRLLAIIVVSTLFSGACGGDDDTGGDVTDETTASTADSADSASDSAEGQAEANTEEAAAMPDGCPASVPFTTSARFAGEGALQAFEVLDAVALSRADGAAYTIYLADFDMDDDTNWGFAVPEVPAGSTLIATGLDVFNADPATLEPLEVGSSGPLFAEAGEGVTATFISVTSELVDASSVNQMGTATLLHLDDSQVCIEVDITSDSGIAFSGTLAAPIAAAL
jgi:hypothetical protein